MKAPTLGHLKNTRGYHGWDTIISHDPCTRGSPDLEEQVKGHRDMGDISMVS